MKFLIKDANVVLENSVKKKDILVKNGIIYEIKNNIKNKEDAILVDANNLFCMPGLVDLHVHLREPGFVEKETIRTGSLAAAKGGVTSLVCMANTNPVIDNVESLKFLKKIIKKQNVKIYPVAAITKNLKGKKLVDFSVLKEFGAVGFSDDGFFLENSSLMKTAMKKAKKLNVPIFSHCEDYFLSAENKFETDCEAVAVARDVALCYITNCPVHICHVSSFFSVTIIREAKKLKVPVTAQTCPHYFMLTKKERLKKDPNFKMNPPLASTKDKLAIEQALLDGTIDCIATDHAPHEEKSKENFETAANGVVGLETSLACTITKFYKTNKMSLPKIVNLLSTNPAKILKLKKTGAIKKGWAADIILVDLNKKWKVTKDCFLSKSKNSPFIGKTLTAKITHTFCEGKLIYKNI